MASIQAPTVAVVGSTNIDLITYTRRVPGPGETLVGERFQMGFGGKGANQAVMARLLGANVVMINTLGSDAYGEMALDNFESFGIDTTFIRRIEGSSGVAPIWVEPDGTNRIIIVPGANNEMTELQAADAVTNLDCVDIVIGQLEIPQAVTAAGFRAAHAREVPTVLNPAPAADLDPALVDATDWLIPNEVEFERLTGSPASDDAITRFATTIGCRLAVTMGEAGVALLAGNGEVEHIATDRVEAVDTTGAGDAFVGAFSMALATGLTETQAVLLGNLCAAASVTRPGTQTSFPDRDAAAALLAQVIG